MDNQPLTLQQIPVGSHLCQIFDTQQDRIALADSMIRYGIERGDQILYLIDEEAVEDIIFHLLGKDLKAERYLASGQLHLQPAHSLRCLPAEKDSLEDLLSFFILRAKRALQEGFSGLRIVDNSGWVLLRLFAASSIEFKARLGDMLREYHITAISQHFLPSLEPAALREIVTCYPLVVIGQELFQNFYYVPPAAFISCRPAEVQFTQWVSNLLNFKRTMEQLYFTRFWVESASDCIYWVAPGGNLEYVNRAACQLLEYSFDQLTTMKVADIDSSVSTESWREKWTTLKKNGSLIFESHHRTSSGKLIPVEIKANYLRYAGREYVCAVARDISERKNTELALQQSEEKYKLVADFTYDWEYWIAPSGKYMYISPSCERITGYSAEEFNKNPRLLQKITLPADREKIKRHEAQNQKKARHVCQIDFRIRTKDGDERWISHHCQPIYNKAGEWLGQRGSNRDITDRKRAEEALRKSEEQFRLLIEGVKDYAIYNLDPDGKVTSWNAGVERLSGFKAEDVLGKDIDVFYLPGDIARKKPQYELIMAMKKGCFENEGWRLRKDGSRLWVHSVTTALRDETGKLTGYVRIIRDITDRKMEQDKQTTFKPSALSDY